MKKLFPLLLATALIVPSVSCKKEAGPVYPTFPNYEKQAETTPGAATDVKDDAAYLDGVFSDALSSLNSDEILLFLQNIQSLQFLSDEKTDVSIFQTTIMAAMMEAGEDFPGLSLDLLSGSYALELMGEVWTVNDNLTPAGGHASVTDMASGRVLLDTDWEIGPNAAEKIGSVEWRGQGVLDIKYTVGDQAFGNWYLYGTPPFDRAKTLAFLHPLL